MPKLISEEQLNSVIQTIEKGELYQKNAIGNFLKWRDSTAILLLYFAVLRPAEALMLKWEDIDFDKNLLYVKPYYNKERNDMPAILTERAKAILQEYKIHFDNFCPQCLYLFPSTTTLEPITTSAFGKRFQGVCREAGLLQLQYYNNYGKPVYNLRLYSMRHAACTKIYKKTHSEEAVTQLARHLRPESAHVYIHLNYEDKKELIESIWE